MITENSTPNGLSRLRSSEPVAGGTWLKAWFCSSRPTVVHMTAKNASCPTTVGVQASAGTRGSATKEVISEKRPTNRNIQLVRTLTSRVRPMCPTTAISKAKNTAPTNVSRSPI